MYLNAQRFGSFRLVVRNARELLRKVVLQSYEHGLGRRPDILQECENHGHPCSNGDTSNLR